MMKRKEERKERVGRERRKRDGTEAMMMMKRVTKRNVAVERFRSRKRKQIPRTRKKRKRRRIRKSPGRGLLSLPGTPGSLVTRSVAKSLAATAALTRIKHIHIHTERQLKQLQVQGRPLIISRYAPTRFIRQPHSNSLLGVMF